MDAPKRIEILARGLWRHGSTVLVCRNVQQGYCYLPGGHVEPGEPAVEALAREFLEEAGLTVRVGVLCLVSEQRFVQNGKPRHELNLVFHVEQAAVVSSQVTAAATPPPLITSLEPEITFEWLDSSMLGASGFLPSNLSGPIGAIAEMPARASVVGGLDERATAMFVPQA